MSIQSKLLIMLLGVSIGSTLVVGYIGHTSATESLRQSEVDRMTSLREAKSDAIESLFESIEDGLVLDSVGATANQAAVEFAGAFSDLQSQPTDAIQAATVAGYYSDTFIPGLNDRSGSTSVPDAFLPRSSAETYLQNFYTAPTAGDGDAAALVENAGDGSAWSAVNEKYNPYFREMVLRDGFQDALVLDLQGNVVYSVYKSVDLGSNVITGPYKGTILAHAYTDALNSNVVDYAQITDFDRYQPSLGMPTAWGVSPIGQGGDVVGVLAVQLPIDVMNGVMTGNQEWKKDGLGETGEAYIVGPDDSMRSVSRLLIDDPNEYRARAISGGLDPATAQRIVDVGGTVELQTVETAPVREAQQGRTGVMVARDYLDRETLAAYAPLDIQGQQWVIIASITSAEAFAPVADFTRNLVLSMATLLVIVALLSLLLAQVFARPVRRLVGAVRRVAGGDLGVEVAANTRDEFGDLALAFNGMSRSLQVKQALIDEQQAENDKILHRLMPESVARRYRDGDETIAEDHQDVSVLFADLVGFDDFAAGLGAEKELALLNDLVRQFDETAQEKGIEKVRTLREGYLASCGLIVPRVDSARRTVDFALEMIRIVERFNAQHAANLSLRAGIDSGTVTSGLVGRSSIAYDMWGDAVNIANRVQALAGKPGVFLSQRVRDKVGDLPDMTEVGTIETKAGPQSVWQISQQRG